MQLPTHGTRNPISYSTIFIGFTAFLILTYGCLALSVGWGRDQSIELGWLFILPFMAFCSFVLTIVFCASLIGRLDLLIYLLLGFVFLHSFFIWYVDLFHPLAVFFAWYKWYDFSKAFTANLFGLPALPPLFALTLVWPVAMITTDNRTRKKLLILLCLWVAPLLLYLL